MRRFFKKINKKYLVVPCVFLIVLSMTIVCASLSSTMYINGDANLRVDANIRIKSVVMTNPVSEAYEEANIKFGKDTADLFPTLPNLDSEITFKVTVENNSNDVYVISAIDETLTNEYIVSNIDSYEGTIINSNSQVDLDITYSYDGEVESLPQVITQTAKLTFTFEKPSANMIEYTSNYTAETNVQDALDELYEIFE